MTLNVPVSLGELVDKITILEIKCERLKDAEKVKHAKKEKDLLENCLKSLGIEGWESLRNELKVINETLWEIEDDIRAKERDKAFDDEFVQLARNVYLTNDKRFEAKNKLNQSFGSEICEVKSYEGY